MTSRPRHRRRRQTDTSPERGAKLRQTKHNTVSPGRLPESGKMLAWIQAHSATPMKKK
jgi:hypothetical protein